MNGDITTPVHFRTVDRHVVALVVEVPVVVRAFREAVRVEAILTLKRIAHQDVKIMKLVHWLNTKYK